MYRRVLQLRTLRRNRPLSLLLILQVFQPLNHLLYQVHNQLRSLRCNQQVNQRPILREFLLKRFNYISKKLIIEIDPNNIPNYKDFLPTLAKADYMSEDGKVYTFHIRPGVLFSAGLIRHRGIAAL